MELHVQTGEFATDTLLRAALSLLETMLPVLRNTETLLVTTDTLLETEPLPEADMAIVYCHDDPAKVSHRFTGETRVLPLPLPLSLPVLEKALLDLPAHGRMDNGSLLPQTAPALVLIPGENAVRLGKESVRLTETEFALLSVLYDRRGQLVSRESLKKTVWPEGVVGNACEVHMTHLRHKLSALLGEGVLVSVRGKGYILHERS